MIPKQSPVNDITVLTSFTIQCISEFRSTVIANKKNSHFILLQTQR